jgi:F0F1-type ATP synthase assembly protein I
MKKVDSTIINDVFFKKHHHIYGRVVGITLLCCSLIFGLGYGLDMYFGTKPTLMIIGMVAGLPLIQLVIYKKMGAYAKHQVEKSKLKKH